MPKRLRYKLEKRLEDIFTKLNLNRRNESFRATSGRVYEVWGTNIKIWKSPSDWSIWYCISKRNIPGMKLSELKLYISDLQNYVRREISTS